MRAVSGRACAAWAVRRSCHGLRRGGEAAQGGNGGGGGACLFVVAIECEADGLPRPVAFAVVGMEIFVQREGGKGRFLPNDGLPVSGADGFEVAVGHVCGEDVQQQEVVRRGFVRADAQAVEGEVAEAGAVVAVEFGIVCRPGNAAFFVVQLAAVFVGEDVAVGRPDERFARPACPFAAFAAEDGDFPGFVAVEGGEGGAFLLFPGVQGRFGVGG